MRKSILLFAAMFFWSLSMLNAQTSILVYSENFQNGAPGTLLNTAGVGTNSGANMWVINNTYNGAPLYPNTPDQNQVSGGTISFAPTSLYLHIYDQSSGITNCNYNPTVASDRFVQLTNGFCTLGMQNVKFTFFYICQGSPTAYGEIYYSVDSGPWISTGTQYSNQSIWQYEIIQNPAFNNKVNLRFGIRWVNNSGSLPGLMSFGIDDIFITGEFDNFVTNFNVIVDSVTPNPICQNFNLMIYYHLTVPICGSGFYEVQMSDASGSFASPTSLGIYMASNQWMNGILFPTIPSTTAPGSCYKIRIKFYYTTYALNFYSNTSVCIVVQACPNTITTMQPVITMGGDSVCVGSVIDVPFYSTGIFQNNNVYIAELSDSNGVFSSNLNILGSSPDPNAYDPALGSPPGSVSGMITETNQPIPDGCNYYIRIRSTNPVAVGTIWGPFCIRHCDIETNHKVDIQACISSTQGFDTTVFVNIHYYDSSAVYGVANQFLIEVHESQFFSVVNVGGLGSVTSDNDTTLNIHIPATPGLGALGLAPGVYYLRIIANSSNHTYDVLGTLIHLTIGAPADDLSIWQDPPDSVLCVGDAIFFYPIPYNAGPPMNSTYIWYLNGNQFSTDPAIGILFNGAGNYNLTVQENNYGCLGPVVPNSVSLQVLGAPSAVIVGLYQACVGDTLFYQSNFFPNVYYEWSISGGNMIDTSNNELYVLFTTPGVYTINLLTLNQCGQTIGHKNIIVSEHPDPSFTVTTPICAGENSVILYTGTTAPPLTYIWNFDGGLGSPGGNSPGPHNVAWNTSGQYEVILEVTQYGCSTWDTNYVNVMPSPIAAFSYTDHCAGVPITFTDSLQGNQVYWLWNFGDQSPLVTGTSVIHTYSQPGNYWITLIDTAANGCTDTLVQNFVVSPSPSSDFYTKSPICTGDNSLVNYTGSATIAAIYTWDFSSGTIVSGEGQGPYEISWPGNGTYTVSLSVNEGGCTSIIHTDSVNVNGCEITIPNIITPNGDGLNDVFHIKGLESFPDSKLILYNRWGKAIYKSDNYLNDWDGADHSDGVYYYVLTLQNGESRSGTVTLLR
jgi:gliding motility-associated-like protein